MSPRRPIHNENNFKKINLGQATLGTDRYWNGGHLDFYLSYSMDNSISCIQICLLTNKNINKNKLELRNTWNGLLLEWWSLRFLFTRHTSIYSGVNSIGSTQICP